MVIFDVLITLFVIGAMFAMGVVTIAFLELRHRLRRSMVKVKFGRIENHVKGGMWYATL